VAAWCNFSNTQNKSPRASGSRSVVFSLMWEKNIQQLPNIPPLICGKKKNDMIALCYSSNTQKKFKSFKQVHEVISQIPPKQILEI
jgi:hypothetical protein